MYDTTLRNTSSGRWYLGLVLARLVGRVLMAGIVAGLCVMFYDRFSGGIVMTKYL
jgi:hypothetical protein